MSQASGRFVLFAKVLAVSFVAVAMTACKEVKVENGEVPDEYRALAAQYMGTYSGSMDRVPGAITFAFVGRKVVATYQNNSGNDILNPRCESRIGNLLGVTVEGGGSKGDVRLTAAKFAFDPNYCWPSVKGRELVVSFRNVNGALRANASILIDETFERRCRIIPGNPSARIPPREVCDMQPISQYSSGRFDRR